MTTFPTQGHTHTRPAVQRRVTTFASPPSLTLCHCTVAAVAALGSESAKASLTEDKGPVLLTAIFNPAFREVRSTSLHAVSSMCR
jgi:hypothetical protein